MHARYGISAADREFLASFECGSWPLAEFHHREHLRLAYILLAQHDPRVALDVLRSGLQTYLRHHGIDPAKYHETMTHAWLLAVHHFMQRGAECEDSGAFLDAHTELLDPAIMLTHYAQETLRSEPARASFVEPDLDPIPRHGS